MSYTLARSDPAASVSRALLPLTSAAVALQVPATSSIHSARSRPRTEGHGLFWADVRIESETRTGFEQSVEPSSLNLWSQVAFLAMRLLTSQSHSGRHVMEAGPAMILPSHLRGPTAAYRPTARSRAISQKGGGRKPF